MKISNTIPLLIILFTSSCLFTNNHQNKYEFWNISKFNIDNNALTDSEEIKLIYSSRGPDFNKDLEYYFHIIAVSQKTGDTVNILTSINNGFKTDEADKVYNFFNQDNIITKMMHVSSDSSNKMNHVDDYNNFKYKKISKVARDPNFDYLADNQYPTIIGSIGTLSKKTE
jgi:hypothetical protein